MSAPDGVESAIVSDVDGVLVMNKPAGVPTAGDTLDQPGSLQFELMARYRRMVWAVHQLDRDTSGLNVFVRRKSLVAKWVELLRSGTKTYLVVCDGAYEGGTVNAPLGWVGQGVRGITDDGKAARTTFRRVASTGEHTLLEADLHTGRTHQIRLHLAHVGHPVTGDERYGGSSRVSERQLLHAWRLSVGDSQYEAEPPADMIAALDELFGEANWRASSNL